MDAPAPSLHDGFPEADVPFGHFRVPRRPDGTLWELGRGAMGVTYRAFDTSLRTEVALKVIRADRGADENTRRRFQREARAAAKIRHPNVANVLYLGEQGGEFFYAMEFVAGRSLDALLKETAGPLPPVQAVALAAQVAAALNAAHKREVIHRDLKPANLMLLEGDALDHTDERTEAAGNRLLKVIDFGLARSFSSERPDESLVTQTVSGFLGTPAYASPEQALAVDDLDGRSDLYSLGVILWQMLAGQLPFTGRVLEVMGKHQLQPPPLDQLAHLPAALVELLAGLLTKDPVARRPQTAGELRTDLDRFLSRGRSSDGTLFPTDDRHIDETIGEIGKTTSSPGPGMTLAGGHLPDDGRAGGAGNRLASSDPLSSSSAGRQPEASDPPVPKLTAVPLPGTFSPEVSVAPAITNRWSPRRFAVLVPGLALCLSLILGASLWWLPKRKAGEAKPPSQPGVERASNSPPVAVADVPAPADTPAAVERPVPPGANPLAAAPLAGRSERPPAIPIQLTTDKTTYHAGDDLIVTVRVAAAGHLRLLYQNAAGEIYTLFPNQFITDDRIEGGRPVQVMPTVDPARPGEEIALQIQGPSFGTEHLVAIVSNQPFTDEDALRDELRKATFPKSADHDLERVVAKDARAVVRPAHGGSPDGASAGFARVTLTTLAK